MAAPAAYLRRSYVGNASGTTVPLGIATGDGSCALASGTNWPSGSGGDFLVVIDRGLNTEEKAWGSSTSGTTLTFAARGAEGTTAQAHGTGCSIALCTGSQDADESNQVANQVLGQSGAAKGDILAMLSAVGPNTLTRVPIGTTSMTLGVSSGLPAYSVSPGTLLATQQYAPGSRTAIAVNAGSMAALDTTNLTLTASAPASGNLDIRVSIFTTISATTTVSDLAFCLFTHGTTTQVGSTFVSDSVVVISSGGASSTGTRTFTFHLTGLTPGSVQYDLAAGVTSTSGTGAFVVAFGTTGLPTEPNQGAPALLQAFAA